MAKKPKFRPRVTRIKLNPEQAVLSCNCYGRGYIMGVTTPGNYNGQPTLSDLGTGVCMYNDMSRSWYGLGDYVWPQRSADSCWWINTNPVRTSNGWNPSSASAASS